MSLPQLIANVRGIFRNEIDKMMTLYRKANPDFYNGYFAARVIVNRASMKIEHARVTGLIDEMRVAGSRPAASPGTPRPARP